MALRPRMRTGALVLVVAACATAGCGLPDALPTLPAPQEPGSSIARREFTFSVPGNTASPFLGIELYYRLSPVGSEPVVNAESRTDLQARGFHRVARHDDRYPSPDRPLIDQPGAGAVVTVDFSGTETGEDPIATFRDRDGGTREVSLRRSVNHPNGEYKRFACDEFVTGDNGTNDDPGDIDIESVQDELADPGDCEIVRLQLYALSYGEADRLPGVYSDGLDLGTIDLRFEKR